MKDKQITNLIRDYENKKMSHAYLIETNNQVFCIEDIMPIVKKLSCLDNYSDNCNKCNLCTLIDKHESLNFYYIEPDGINIKKEQVLDLKNKCSVLPTMSKNNVYIIKNAEKLNSSSANTMLKFVEEPFDNCYGFFITNNKNNVINTIRSRCEIISLKYDKSSILDELSLTNEEYENHLNNVLTYLYKIEVEKKDSILYNRTILNEIYKEKRQAVIYFKIILNVYENLFKSKVTDNKIDERYKFLFNISTLEVNQRKKLVVDIINKLNYNLNIELAYDRFIIELGELNG